MINAPELDSLAVNLGKAIRDARLCRGFSQELLAEKSGLHRTYIGMVERGERNITLLNYARIARALDKRVVDLAHDLI